MNIININGYTITIPEYMLDFLQVLQHSADSGKYEPNNWLNKDGKGCDHRSMYASIHRHISHCSVGDYKDRDSGLDHRLHAAVRLMMDYTRDKIGLNEGE